jgi:hypothetical protein
MFHARPGYRSDGTATLQVEELGKPKETPDDAISWMQKKLRDVASYELRYLPDTHEVVLLKLNDDGDRECVYSEAFTVDHLDDEED